MSVPVEIPEDIVERIRALGLALPEVTVRVDGPLTRTRSTARSFDILQRSFCLLVAVEDSTGKPIPLLENDFGFPVDLFPQAGAKLPALTTSAHPDQDALAALASLAGHG